MKKTATPVIWPYAAPRPWLRVAASAQGALGRQGLAGSTQRADRATRIIRAIPSANTAG
jgi:hypothetical protein